ncbi:MAG: winged helix-turn-helix domain-containing protein, partial [Thermoanaerobaculia bacterium]
AAGGTAVNAGIYFLDRRALDRVAEDRPTDFGADLLPALAREEAPVFGWDLPGYWRDVGTPQALALARREVRELPQLRALKTRWPAARIPGGGRIWVHSGLPGGGWMEMNTSSIGEAAGRVWQHLAGQEEKGCTLSKLEKLQGVDPRTALAAVGWLAREGKVRFSQEGRATRVQLASWEAQRLV